MTRQGALDPASGLYFTEHGSASHPAIVLTHSILADGRMWDRQVAWLAKEYRVINVDLPGHGQCPLVPGGVSLASLADGIVKLAAARGLESFHYVGVSLGAMIGYELATRRSTWLASMVACDAPPFAPDNYPALWEARISRAQRDGTAALVEETLQRWFTPQTLARRPDYVEELSETIAQTSAEGFEHCALAISRFDYRDALRACTGRTLAPSMNGSRCKGKCGLSGWRPSKRSQVSLYWKVQTPFCSRSSPTGRSPMLTRRARSLMARLYPAPSRGPRARRPLPAHRARLESPAP